MHLASVDLNTSLIRSVLLVWLTLNLGLDFLEAQKPRLNMLFVIPANTSEAIANQTAPALVIALKSIQARRTLSQYEVDWQIIDVQCSTTLTARFFYETWINFNKQLHVIFGGFCENVCQLLAIIAQSLNVPFMAVACKSTDERNHLLFPTYLTMEAWRPSVFPVLIALSKAYSWTTMAILATSDPTSVEMGLKVKDAFEDNNWTAVFILTTTDMMADGFLSEEADEEVELILEEIKKHARVIFLAMEKIHAARILVLAQKHGMYNGEYVFIGFALPYVEASAINATNDEWREAKVGLLYFRSINNYKGLEDGRFFELMNAKEARNHKKLSWLEHRKLDPKVRLYKNYAGDLYCVIRVYSYLVNHTVVELEKESTDSVVEKAASNGKLLMSKFYELSSSATATNLEDSLDMLMFDSVGRRAPSWGFYNSREFDHEDLIYGYVPVGEECESLPFPKRNLTWPGKVTEAPLDGPKCGFENEKCVGKLVLILICTCSVLGVIAISAAFIAFFYTRRMRLEMEKKTLAEWQVKWSKVVIIGDSVVGRLSTHDTIRSKASFELGSLADHADARSSHRSIISDKRLYTLAGIYKGKTVAIKKINRGSVDIFLPTIYNEIQQLFYISHENVNPFLGVCAVAPNVCVLMLYADRGSLQDVLDESKYDINWEFRHCLATDITKGMEYLHESPVGPHGHLTSSNCVVDRKWECRITDYGLKQFKQSHNPEMATLKWNSDLLWTAPEILKKPETDQTRIYGTKEGDVYSFGIIASELITKELPFHSQLDSMTSEDIISKLKSDPHFRPDLPDPEGTIGSSWNSLAALCWHRKPEVRPTFGTIRGKLRLIHGGKTPHLMERVHRMLEDALERKATDIAAEKKRTESVVYSLLPKSVADKIVTGKEVRPQRIDSVTLCLCETSDLYTSTKGLSPVQMTELLKSLFRIYDDVIKRYHVTEVNCRGSKDSMILGSGIPHYTEKHAQDICDLSLDLISEALSFKTPFVPALSLSIKISVHSGPVLTAVIWRMLPRYCINGEAVQTLTAMHSASKAMRVRISEATYGHISETGGFTAEQGGKVTFKDGKPMRSYWLTGKTGYRKPLPKSISRRSSSVISETEDWKRH